MFGRRDYGCMYESMYACMKQCADGRAVACLRTCTNDQINHMEDYFVHLASDIGRLRAELCSLLSKFLATVNSPASSPWNARLMQIRTWTHTRVQELAAKHTHTNTHTDTPELRGTRNKHMLINTRAQTWAICARTRARTLLQT